MQLSDKTIMTCLTALNEHKAELEARRSHRAIVATILDNIEQAKSELQEYGQAQTPAERRAFNFGDAMQEAHDETEL